MRRMYSLAQIQAIVALMAKEGELDFSDVDLKVKTLEQSQPNWSVDLSEVELNVSPNTLTAQNIFSRLQVVNKELEIVFTFSITNPTEETINPSNIQLGTFDIPSSIGEKLIDLEGHNLTTSDELVAIAGEPMCNGTSKNIFSQRFGILNVSHNGTNKVFIACYSLQGIGAGATHYYTGRIQLALI